MGPPPVPPLDPAPAPTTSKMAGPLPGPASTSVMKPNMLDHQDSASHDTEVSEERIRFYLKRNGVEKSPRGSSADAASTQIPQGPPSERSSEALSNETPSHDVPFREVGVRPTRWNRQ